MKEILKLGLVLALVCMIAAVALAGTNELTKDKIVEQRFLANEKTKKEVLATAERFEDLAEDQLLALQETYPEVVEVSIGRDGGGTAVGYVIKALSNGYGGAVEIITGIDSEGVLSGVRVGNHQETPGLGAKAKEAFFYDQYTGLSADEKLGTDAVDAIAGATITSNAVTRGVNFAVDVYGEIVSEGGQ